MTHRKEHHTVDRDSCMAGREGATTEDWQDKTEGEKKHKLVMTQGRV